MENCREKEKLLNRSEQIKIHDSSTELMVAILSHIVEVRNGESGSHVQNITYITEMLLRCLLDKTAKYDGISGDIDTICAAASFHDIGKMNVPVKILNKPGRLTPEEYEKVKTHCAVGEEMMNKLRGFQDEPLIRYCRQICRWHHERWDGNGYPDGLAGDDIPIAAQVVSLADVYDALTSERCYKEAYSHEKAMEMIMNGECGEFNPLLLECLTDIEPQLREIPTKTAAQSCDGVKTSPGL